MTLSFLPGVPNSTPQSTCQRSWNEINILAYCSGNNLILLSNRSERLQTIYLPSDCHAVDINTSNGLIAVAVNREVYIYKPLHQVMKNPKWVFCTKIFHDESKVNSLQWGMANEIVIGSDYLSFWDVKDVFGEYKPKLLWSKRHPLPVYLCSVTADSKLIASMCYKDRAVKLWRRVSMTGDSDIFDLIILPHPDFVTTFRWKTNDHLCDKEHTVHVIYTLCSDSKLRIWISFDVDNARNVQNWGTIPLSKENNERFCVVLDSWLIQRSLGNNVNKLAAKNNLIKYIDENKPELVLFSSASNKIRVIALENLSHEPPKSIVTREILNTSFSTTTIGSSPEFVYFPEPQIYDDNQSISFVVHDLHGSVRHSLLHIPSIITGKEHIGLLQNKWTGHTKSIQKVFRSSDGSAVLTTSRFQENSVWVPLQLKNSVTLIKKSLIITESPIKYALVHDKGNLIISFLEDYRIQLWICPSDEKKATLRCTIYSEKSKGYPSIMVNTPEKDHHSNRHMFACIFADGSTQGYIFTSAEIKPIESKQFDLVGQPSLYLISAIDPVRYSFQSERSLVASITNCGVIRIYKANADSLGIKWQKSFEIHTNVRNASKITGSSNDKISVIDEKGTSMTLWDLRRGVLEYECTFDDKVVDIDWTSTELEQSIVAIGFENHVILYTQLRYDYTNRNPSYLPIEKIDISQHTTHAIGDSTWLKGGSIIIATGNQVFVQDKALDLNDKFTYQSIGSRKILSNDIMHLTSVLNGPLPVYHPQLLVQALFAKKINLVREILLKLFHVLREIEFNSKDIQGLGASLNIESSKFLHSDDSTYVFDKYEEPYDSFNKTVSSSLIEKLAKMPLPYLTRHQQVTLISVIEAVERINLNEKIVDINGVRFMLGVNLYTSHKSTQSSVNMRDACWATHSDNKGILLSTLSPKLQNWTNAKEYKVAFWAEQEGLIKTFEEIAKVEFNLNEKRDPAKCSIFYLALRKKSILLGLWRISTGHPEQAKMLKFLKNDFSEPRWRSAALKNAFVLLSKHRYMDAASFFLLAGALKDSANVLLKQLNDLDLAIGVCRVYEGDNGPVLNEFLRNQVLPIAVMESDRWTTSYVYWKMKRQALSIKALVQAPVEIDNNEEWIDKDKCVNKSFLVEDPLLLQLYLQLRSRNLSYYKAALEVNESLEYEIISRVVTIYSRMGCDYLAVALVKNWKFIDARKIYNVNVTIDNKENTVDTSIEEPTSTQKVRPSLFDKFETEKTISSASTSRNAINSSSSAQTIFSTSGYENQPSYITPNILDSFSGTFSADTNETNSHETAGKYSDDSGSKPKSNPSNILDSFETFDNAPKTSTKENSSKNVISQATSNKTPSQPKNLLDSFM